MLFFFVCVLFCVLFCFVCVLFCFILFCFVCVLFCLSQQTASRLFFFNSLFAAIASLFNMPRKKANNRSNNSKAECASDHASALAPAPPPPAAPPAPAVPPAAPASASKGKRKNDEATAPPSMHLTCISNALHKTCTTPC